MPSFNGFSTVFEAEYQRVPVLGYDFRLIANILICGHGRQRRLRYLLGGTGGTALIIVGAANPHRTGGSNFSPVVLAAVSARDQAGEWVSAGKELPDRSVFLGPLCNFGLYRLIILQADNGLVRTLLSLIHI